MMSAALERTASPRHGFETTLYGLAAQSLGRNAAKFIQADHERPYFGTIAFNAVENFCRQLRGGATGGVSAPTATAGSRTWAGRTPSGTTM
jgi:hypothetical protein